MIFSLIIPSPLLFLLPIIVHHGSEPIRRVCGQVHSKPLPSAEISLEDVDGPVRRTAGLAAQGVDPSPCCGHQVVGCSNWEVGPVGPLVGSRMVELD